MPDTKPLATVTVAQDASPVTLYAAVLVCLQSRAMKPVLAGHEGNVGKAANSYAAWKALPWADFTFTGLRARALEFRVYVAMGPVESHAVKAFRAAYVPALQAAVTANPGDYAYRGDATLVVCERMILAWLAGTANHEGQATRAACKALGIPHTRKALKAWFASEASHV